MKIDQRWFKSTAGSIVLLACSAVLGACSRGADGDGSPRWRLEQYVARSFAVKDSGDRELLIEHLTGDAKIRLASWSDDQFRAAFVDAKRTFVKLLVVEERKVDERNVDLTYEITFLDSTREGGGGAKVVQRKVCRVREDDGLWRIAEVRNVKELVEFQSEMTFP
jgi:hypothetical protein